MSATVFYPERAWFGAKLSYFVTLPGYGVVLIPHLCEANSSFIKPKLLAHPHNNTQASQSSFPVV